jgi:uncharacterized protein YqjF (DUF2071 family)
MTDPNWQQRLDIRQRPSSKPVMHQDWQDILFMHWKIDPQEIQKTLPQGLFVDTHEGDAYVSLVAFIMNDVRLCLLKFMPGLGDYIEVNVRTYVHDGNGNTGVWFYSLDLDSYLGSKIARTAYSLPYIYTHLKGTKSGQQVEIEGHRSHENVFMNFTYEPISSKYSVVDTSSLDFFLIERYALFTKRKGTVFIGRVHHEPYRISPARITHYSSNLLESHGFSTSEPIDLYHYTPGVTVDIFNLRKIQQHCGKEYRPA